MVNQGFVPIRSDHVNPRSDHGSGSGSGERSSPIRFMPVLTQTNIVALKCLSFSFVVLHSASFASVASYWDVTFFIVEQARLGSEIAAYVLQADWTVDDSALRIDLVHRRMTMGESRLQVETDPGKRPPFATAYAVNSASDYVDKNS